MRKMSFLISAYAAFTCGASSVTDRAWHAERYVVLRVFSIRGAPSTLSFFKKLNTIEH
jgi:hypothetical protein